MINPTYKNWAIVVLVGVIICLLFFRSCGHDPVKPVISAPKQLLKIVEKDSVINKKKVDSLNKENDKHKADADRAKIALVAANKNIVWLQDQLEGIINSAPTEVSNDYTDDLRSSFKEYSVASDKRDSLNNEQLAATEAQVKTLGGIVAAKDTLNAQLKRAFTVANSDLQKSINYSAQLKKQVNKKKINILIWKAAAIAGGLLVLKKSL